MNAINRPAASDAEGEQLIGALVPAALPERPPPIPAPLPALPPLRLPSGVEPNALLVDMGHLDRSGRVYTRTLLDAFILVAGSSAPTRWRPSGILVGTAPLGR